MFPIISLISDVKYDGCNSQYMSQLHTEPIILQGQEGFTRPLKYYHSISGIESKSSCTFTRPLKYYHSISLPFNAHGKQRLLLMVITMTGEDESTARAYVKIPPAMTIYGRLRIEYRLQAPSKSELTKLLEGAECSQFYL